MGLNLKLTTDKWLTTDIGCTTPMAPKTLPLGASGFGVMLQRDWGRFKSEPAIQEWKSGIVFSVANETKQNGFRAAA